VGKGQRGFAGDGGPASLAGFQNPHALAIDRAGALYISDPGEDTVRKVESNGTISTVAGTGILGFNGDALPGRLTSLNDPTGLALDGCGDLYVADTGNDRVRKLTSSQACPSPTASRPPGGSEGSSRLVLPVAAGIGVAFLGGLVLLFKKRRISTGN
ncbi:MAG: hypothetical protein ACRDIU_01705, partial [Actinomycetota bacterium]